MYETAPFYANIICRGGVSPPMGRETRPLQPGIFTISGYYSF